MLAPIFLLLGLSTSAPETVSLLNNFEIVATTVIAVSLFHEKAGARTSAYYAVSPFVGVLLSLLIFRQMPGSLFWIALVIMGIGVYFNIQDTFLR